MSNEARLLAVRFDDPLKAQEMLIAMMRLQNRGSLVLDDAAIVTKAGGRVRIHQTKDTNPTEGAATGTWFGVLAGLVFMQPLIGAALGAAIGGLWAKLHDIGIDDATMKDMGDSLGEKEAALFLLFSQVYTSHLSAEFSRFDGRVMHSTLDPDDTAMLDESMSRAGF